MINFLPGNYKACPNSVMIGSNRMKQVANRHAGSMTGRRTIFFPLLGTEAFPFKETRTESIDTVGTSIPTPP